MTTLTQDRPPVGEWWCRLPRRLGLSGGPMSVDLSGGPDGNGLTVSRRLDVF